MKKGSSLEKSRKRTEAALNAANAKIEELGGRSSCLYNTLGILQDRLDKIRNVPEEKRFEYEAVKKIRLNWKQQAEKIEKDYDATQIKAAGKGAAGTSAGFAVATLGPTAAMGIATTFGVASTGTAISTLSGAAATNAALAWLGGGALAAGGGGMVAGQALLALAGPIGWSIAGVALLSSGIMLFKSRSEKKRIERIFDLISKRDTRSYKLAIVEIEERIKRIDTEQLELETATKNVMSFGLDYDAMTEEQQFKLGACVNLMNASTQLLVNPILGLQPKYTKEDFDKFLSLEVIGVEERKKGLIIQLCNLLYRIELDEKDRKLLRKSLRKNKDLLTRLSLKKKDLDDDVMETVRQALLAKYRRVEQTRQKDSSSSQS